MGSTTPPKNINFMFDVDPHHMGPRLVLSGTITNEQREKIVHQQKINKKSGEEWQRFGEIAVQKCFCCEEDIESLNDFIGEKLIEQGIISRDQQKKLIEWQRDLKKSGINVLFGELAVNEGVCSKKDIDNHLNSRPPTPTIAK